MLFNFVLVFQLMILLLTHALPPRQGHGQHAHGNVSGTFWNSLLKIPRLLLGREPPHVHWERPGSMHAGLLLQVQAVQGTHSVLYQQLLPTYLGSVERKGTLVATEKPLWDLS